MDAVRNNIVRQYNWNFIIHFAWKVRVVSPHAILVEHDVCVNARLFTIGHSLSVQVLYQTLYMP